MIITDHYRGIYSKTEKSGGEMESERRDKVNGGCYSLARVVDLGSPKVHLGFPALVCVAGGVRTFDARRHGCDLGEGASVPSY